MESEQVTLVDSVKDIETCTELQTKKAGGHIGRNVLEIKMKTLVQKPLMI